MTRMNIVRGQAQLTCKALVSVAVTIEFPELLPNNAYLRISLQIPRMSARKLKHSQRITAQKNAENKANKEQISQKMRSTLLRYIAKKLQ